MSALIRRSKLSDADVLGRVCAQAWQETYASFMPVETLALVGSIERRTEIRRDMFAKATPDWGYFLAETEQGEVVGHGDCGPAITLKEFGSAEIYTLYLLRSAQGMGVGGKLLRGMLKHLADRGFDSAVLDVFVKNEKALQFYAHLGGKEIQRIQRDFAGTALPLAVFVWSDLKKFAAAF